MWSVRVRRLIADVRLRWSGIGDRCTANLFTSRSAGDRLRRRRAGKGGDGAGAIAGDGQRLPHQTLGDRRLVRGEGHRPRLFRPSLIWLVRFAVRLGPVRVLQKVIGYNAKCGGDANRKPCPRFFLFSPSSPASTSIDRSMH